jgi:hypothetical protein
MSTGAIISNTPGKFSSTGILVGSTYFHSLNLKSPNSIRLNVIAALPVKLWHKHMGHLNWDAIKYAQHNKKYPLLSIKLDSSEPCGTCDGCMARKDRHHIFKSSGSRASEPLTINISPTMCLQHHLLSISRRLKKPSSIGSPAERVYGGVNSRTGPSLASVCHGPDWHVKQYGEWECGFARWQVKWVLYYTLAVRVYFLTKYISLGQKGRHVLSSLFSLHLLSHHKTNTILWQTVPIAW